MEEKKKKVSIYDIAKVLNTSGSTVSRALKDHPSISKKMKERVKKTAQEMNYKPNIVAVNLKSGKSHTIGVVVPSINRSFFSSVIEGIEEEAYKVGYNVIICQSQELYEKEKKIVSSLSQGKVDGIIASVAAGTTKYTHFQNLENIGIPLVLFDRITDKVNAGTVTVDDYKGAYKCVEHLLQSGRKKIFHYAGTQHVSVWYKRCRGYQDALKGNKIDLGSDWIYTGEINREGGEGYARQLIAGKELPDAVFCTSDFVALGMMTELLKQGIEVPQDIAICGFANEPFDELISPSLTSVEQFSKKMGQEAARMLIDSLNGEALVNIVIEPQLVIRESTA